MTDKELMQMALDALIDAADSQNWELQENVDNHGEWYRRSLYLKQATTNSQEAIKALRARLSQCERCGEANPAEIHTCTPKREWQGLTDEEIREFEIWLDDEEEKHGWNLPADIVKYIEAKLKEKNT
jgi:hypothetical protein